MPSDGGGMDQIDAPVVARAKFRPPRPQQETDARRDLVERLRSSPRRLTSISGPPGCGKSTLMASWSETEPAPVWLSLDESDNDPVTLWWSMIEGVRGVVGGFGDDYRERLLTLGPAAVDDTVTAVANELGECDRPVRLFIDDLHLVDRVATRRSLRALIDRLPPGVRAAIASREPSSLPLAKLRIDGELDEVGSGELAMTPEEAQILFSSLGAEVEPGLLAPLIERSAGWPTGVQLAAMAVATGEDPTDVVASFVGNERSIAEHLFVDVLDNFSEEEQRFLLDTSILRQLTGDLCDAVTGGTDGAQKLATLGARSALVVPLDESGTWYRYDRLIGELLRDERRRRQPDSEPELHSRAFDWFRDRRDPEPAIHHGLAAGRELEAADVFCEDWPRFVNTGRIETALALLERFDQQTILGHQPLAIAAAFVCGLSGRYRVARHHLEAAERLDYEGPPPDGTASMTSSLALVRSTLGLDGVGSALSDAELVYSLEPPGSRWRPVAALTIGIARVMRSEFDEAMAPLAEAAAVDRAATKSYGLAALAITRLRRGDVARAIADATEASSIVSRSGLDDLVFSATAAGASALAHIADGNLDVARTALLTAGNAMRFNDKAMPMDALLAHSLLAEAALDLGEHDTALTHLNRSTRIAATLPDVGTVGTTLARLRTRFGQAGAASQSSAEVDAPFSEREIEVMALLPSSLTTREIGEELFLSINTVKTYLRRIYRKLGATSRGEAVTLARERDLIAVPV